VEKMDSEKKCSHVKCYSHKELPGYPPEIEWICELCGDEGAEVAGMHAVVLGRYTQLKAKKERGEFKHR